MFCPNCGVPVADDMKFCASCGANLSQGQSAPAAPAAPVEETPVYEAPVVQTPVYEAPAMAAPAGETTVLEAPAAPVYEAPAAEAPAAPEFAQVKFDALPKPPSKKKLWIILGFVGALVAAAGVATYIFWGAIAGFFVRTFGKPEDYFHFVEKQAVTETADTVSNYYGLVVNTYKSKDNGAKGSMHVQVSDELKDLLGGAAMDLSWINDVSIAYESVVEGELAQINMNLLVSEKKVADLVLIVNTTTGEYYIGVPELNDEYLHYDPYNNYYGAVMNSSSVLNMLSDEAFLKALPDQKTVNALVSKYLQLIIDTTTGVEKSTDTLEIGDLEQKVTVLEYELTQKDLVKIAKAVLKEAKGDKDLKKVINNFAKYLEKQGALQDADQVYESFQEAVESALDTMNMAGTMASSDTLLVLTDYVNGASEIVGRKLTVQDQTILEYATITKGKAFATEWNIYEEKAVLTGEGTIDGDVWTGTYLLKLEGVDYLELEASYNKEKLKAGQLDGRFCIRPSDIVLDVMGVTGQMQSAVISMDLGLEVVVSTGEKEASFAVNLLKGKNVLLGISAKSSAVKSDREIQIPGNTTSINYAESWAEDLDYGKLITALRDTKLPSEIVDQLASAIGEADDPFDDNDDYGDSSNNGYYGDYQDEEVMDDIVVDFDNFYD